jgi:hypothetical protein
MREHSGHVISEFSVTLPVATVFFLVRIAQTGTRRGRTQHVFQAVSRGEACVAKSGELLGLTTMHCKYPSRQLAMVVG